MTLSFNNVIPAPLQNTAAQDTDIWGKTVLFEPGLTYNVLAPSGKGKTTFLHLIAGLRRDYTGEIKIGHEEIRSISADRWTALRKDHVSTVYQDLRLFLKLTGLENINVKAVLYKDIPPARIHEMAALLNVSHTLAKRCETLSYGERQRIAIIRALIQPFDWLLLDEPFSHLDVENAGKAAALIASEVLARKAGVIVTSHGANSFFEYNSKLTL